jgi:signal transduction histidine kinase
MTTFRAGLFLLLFGSITLPFSGARAIGPEAKQVAIDHVRQAIDFAKSHGKDVVIAEINKGKFKDGEVYVTIYDLEGKCLAHPVKPALVGSNLMSVKDPDGVAYVKDRTELVKAKGAGWISYKFPNPVSKKLEKKEAYAELWEGLVFSAGAYEKK